MRIAQVTILAGVSWLALGVAAHAQSLPDLKYPPVDDQPAKVETIPQSLVDALKAGSGSPASKTETTTKAITKEAEKPTLHPQKPVKPVAPTVAKQAEKAAAQAVEAKPVETKPAETKPSAEAKPVETKTPVHTETKTETKPEVKAEAPKAEEKAAAAATAAAAGAKAPDTKTVDTKTVETKSAPATTVKTETKTETPAKTVTETKVTETKPAETKTTETKVETPKAEAPKTEAPAAAKEAPKETSFKEPGFKEEAPVKPKAAPKPRKHVSPKAMSVDGTPVAKEMAAPAAATAAAEEAAKPKHAPAASEEKPKTEAPVKPAAKTANDYTVMRINGSEVKASQIMGQAPNLSLISGAKTWNDLNPPVQDEIAKALIQKTLLLEAADKAVPDTDPEFLHAMQIAKDNARVQLYQQRYMQGRLDEKSVKNLYEERADAYASVTPATNFVQFLTPDQDLIQKVQEALSQGRSIAAVTQAFANSGLVVSEMPNLTREDLPDNMQDDVFALTPGKFSKPLKDEFGWHIFAAKSKGKARLEPMESMRPELETQLAVRRWEEHLAELQKNAKVEYFNPDGSTRKLP
ncbi:hypothetical protein GC177_02225 [bacterium]|nr:hypothetical protein [bacterium]